MGLNVKTNSKIFVGSEIEFSHIPDYIKPKKKRLYATSILQQESPLDRKHSTCLDQAISTVHPFDWPGNQALDRAKEQMGHAYSRIQELYNCIHDTRKWPKTSSILSLQFLGRILWPQLPPPPFRSRSVIDPGSPAGLLSRHAFDWTCIHAGRSLGSCASRAPFNSCGPAPDTPTPAPPNPGAIVFGAYLTSRAT